jgi:hypothetical protein
MIGRHAIPMLLLLLASCAGPVISPLASPTGSPLASPSAARSAAATPSASGSTAPVIGWSLLSSADGPAARSDHTFTLNATGSKAYLFGGQTADGSPLGDLWELDLATAGWRRIDTHGPAPRFGHNAAWVPGVGLVVFAGQGTTFFNDLWSFDPKASRWRKLPGAGDVPVPRYGSCAALGPDGRLWISHGFTSEGTRFADTRAYDFGTRAWTNETPAGELPVKRCLHACWWTDDGRLALYGGQTTGVPALGDLWFLSQGPRPGTNAWSAADVPGALRPRQLPAATRWNAATVVFGGGSRGGGWLADAWRIDDAGRIRRISSGPGPSARAGAELVADPLRHRLLLFGGRNGDGPSAELWALAVPAA